MNKEKPDVSEISLEDFQERRFPLRQDYRITICDNAYQVIYEHARENTGVEICGVLIGDVFKDSGRPYLEIIDAIRGEYATNQDGHVTFTHRTWSYINEVRSSKFPDKRIVGWYHSHPRGEIFLSTRDMFVHENFFNQPWQVAFVVDPVSKDDGFFIWQKGKPIQTKQYWVLGETQDE